MYFTNFYQDFNYENLLIQIPISKYQIFRVNHLNNINIIYLIKQTIVKITANIRIIFN